MVSERGPLSACRVFRNPSCLPRTAGIVIILTPSGISPKLSSRRLRGERRDFLNRKNPVTWYRRNAQFLARNISIPRRQEFIAIQRRYVFNLKTYFCHPTEQNQGRAPPGNLPPITSGGIAYFLGYDVSEGLAGILVHPFGSNRKRFTAY